MTHASKTSKKRCSYSQIFDRRMLIKSNSICNVKNNLYIVPTAYQIFIENSRYFFNTHLKKLLSISVFKTFQHCFSHFTLKKKNPVSITLGKLNQKLYLIFINSLLFIINFFFINFIFNYFFQGRQLYLQDPNQTLDVCVSATRT